MNIKDSCNWPQVCDWGYVVLLSYVYAYSILRLYLSISWFAVVSSHLLHSPWGEDTTFENITVVNDYQKNNGNCLWFRGVSY